MSYTPLDEQHTHGIRLVAAEQFDDEEGTLRPTLSHESRLALSEPLTQGNETNSDGNDPYYVFQVDLSRKLELVDEALAEFLRLVYQTVRPRHG